LLKRHLLIAIAIALMFAYELGYCLDTVYVWYGKPDGSPTGAIIGERLDVSVYASNTGNTGVEYLHLCLGGNDIYIDSFLSSSEGAVHNVINQWDDVAFLSAEGAPPNPTGWSSQSLLGFCDIGGAENPSMNYSNPTLIATFVAKITSDSSLVGDTVTALGVGVNSQFGHSDAENIDEIMPVIEHFNPIYFILPSQSASIRGNIIDRQMGNPAPLANMRIEIEGTRKFAYSSTAGVFSFDRIIPGNYRLKCTHPNFNDTLINISINTGETLIVNIDLHTGSIAGTVSDGSQTPMIPAAGVQIKAVSSRKSDTTDVSGYYQLDKLFPGSYSIIYSNPNYIPDTISGIVVNPEETTTLNVTLTHLPRADIAVTRILSPPESIQANTDYYPSCIVTNYGTDAQIFHLTAKIKQPNAPQNEYTESMHILWIAGLSSTTITFQVPFVPLARQYEVTIFTYLAIDTITGNDTLHQSCIDYLPVEFLGSFNTSGNAMDIAINDNYAFVADGSYGLQVINIENPENPYWVAGSPLNGFSRRIVLAGSLGYLAADMGGLDLLLLAQPTSPHLVHSYPDFGRVSDVAIRGNYAYLACRNDGLKVIDITDSLNFNTVGQLTNLGILRSLALAGQYAYLVCNHDQGQEAMRVVDISAPDSPIVVSQIPLHSLNPLGIKIIGNTAFIITNLGGIISVDISAPANPTIRSTLSDYCSGGFEIAGNYAFVAYFDRIQVYDISDMSSPQYVASYQAGVSGVDGITRDNDKLYLANYDNGIQILRLRDITGPISCRYNLGDINGDNNTGAADVSYGVRYFKGLGPASPIRCWNDSLSNWFSSSGDVNGNCEFYGSDITRLVAYFKGLSALKYCLWTPPQSR
jgi:hypothetical protein